ncbi:hypothetical protein [Pseudodesulfovibrio sp. zrk46]|uniref:hypothetical protein n=1 Tax=Pseudodesulfovibrio sp. zrk46 TaxID=2725288 RepID=UPI001449F61C|nr:hypothetical protein [Pseudodesulfovibrio sp. zrk46]QJB55790.1 hypothetical protein HFN16_04945 [Pseudodesulfovibrio sp. zrk46]
MHDRMTKLMTAITIMVVVWALLMATDSLLYTASDTYQAIADTIDQRDINGGNALNFFGDETSGEAVHQVTQNVSNPMGAD